MLLEEPEHCIDSPVECNLYSFAKNDPLTFSDPTGTLACAGACIAAGVIGTIKAVDFAISAYDAYNSIQDLKDGKTTLEEIAIERGKGKCQSSQQP